MCSSDLRHIHVPNKTLVIVPTFNESGYIGKLLPKLFELNLDALIVDDGSNDGTIDIAKSIATNGSNLNFTNIATYTTIFVFFTYVNADTSGTKPLQIALSSDNGTNYGTARTISAATANITNYGYVTISNTGTNGASKVITPAVATSAGNKYTTAATEATITGVINALRVNSSVTSSAFSIQS